MKSLINPFEQKLEYIFTDFNENSRGYAWYDLNEAFGSEKLSVEQKVAPLHMTTMSELYFRQQKLLLQNLMTIQLNHSVNITRKTVLILKDFVRKLKSGQIKSVRLLNYWI